MWVSIACSDLFLKSTRRNDPPHWIFSQRLCVISTYTNRDFTMPCNPRPKEPTLPINVDAIFVDFDTKFVWNKLIQETIQIKTIALVSSRLMMRCLGTPSMEVRRSMALSLGAVVELINQMWWVVIPPCAL
eukprot:478808_1